MSVAKLPDRADRLEARLEAVEQLFEELVGELRVPPRLRIADPVVEHALDEAAAAIADRLPSNRERRDAAMQRIRVAAAALAAQAGVIGATPNPGVIGGTPNLKIVDEGEVLT